MIKIEQPIRSLYPMNIIEGEGLGTAYEYHVKLKKLQKFIEAVGTPSRILIAGLPEKYGLSMDFVGMGQSLGAETVVIDDRRDIIERARWVFETLKKREFFKAGQVRFLRLDSLSRFDSRDLSGGKFDLALSSEVLQRLGGAVGSYLSSLSLLSKSFAVFVPNKENLAHTRISRLRGMSLKELTEHCSRGVTGVPFYEHGYLDMPPFPPGLRRSQEKRERATQSQFEALLMRGLEIYGRCEGLVPARIRRKKAHLVYAMGYTAP